MMTECFLWKATCRETCPCRLGRGQRKRAIEAPRRCPTSFGGGHTEKGSNAPRWVPTLPLLWSKLSVVWVGTPGAVFPVEWLGHRDRNRSEARLLPLQPSGNGARFARAVSNSEYQ